MDNPTQVLKDYIRDKHPRLTIQPVRTMGRERTAEVWANMNSGSNSLGFHFMIPRSAPEDGRPLCTKVNLNGDEVWEFVESHKMFRGHTQKVRVHLHEFHFGKDVQFALVEVIEGDPERISKVFRMDGDEFSLPVEVLMKSQLARLWGMKLRTTAEERRAPDRLMHARGTL